MEIVRLFLALWLTVFVVYCSSWVFQDSGETDVRDLPVMVVVSGVWAMILTWVVWVWMWAIP